MPHGASYFLEEGNGDMPTRRVSNPAKITPTRLRSFRGIAGKENRVIEKRDPDGRNISNAFANLLENLKCNEFGSMIRRPGKAKTGLSFSNDVDWVGQLSLGGRTIMAILSGGNFLFDSSAVISPAPPTPTPVFPLPVPPLPPPEAEDVGLPDFLYVSDAGNSRVVRCSMDFSTWDTLATVNGTGLTNPRHMHYDTTNSKLYFCDAGNDRIIQCDNDLGNARECDGNAVGDGFTYPYGIAVNDATGDIYVGERNSVGNGRIIKLTLGAAANGTIPDATWDSFDTADGVTIAQARGVAWDATASKLYFVDDWSEYSGSPKTSRVVQCDWGGGNAVVLGGVDEGDGDYEFDSPRSVYFYDTSDQDELMIMDRDNNRLVRTDIGGNFWEVIADFDQPRFSFYDETYGYHYIADSGNDFGVRTKLDRDGWGTIGSPGASTGQFDGPRCVIPVWT
jgi:hypothetical protein